MIMLNQTSKCVFLLYVAVFKALVCVDACVTGNSCSGDTGFSGQNIDE